LKAHISGEHAARTLTGFRQGGSFRTAAGRAELTGDIATANFRGTHQQVAAGKLHANMTRTEDHRVWIGLGSNLGDSRAILTAAAEQIATWSTQPLVRSSLWRSTPVGCPPGSPDFLNAVVGLAPVADETPESLLTKLLQLERAFGRQPKQQPNEDRPLDLDLLAFGHLTRATAQLTLPHPRAQLRRFVLMPWNEVAPDLILPGQHETVGGLLTGLQTGERLSRLGSW